ncbi:hypothetical protein TNCV_3177801 [Trichonephila clavipes]|nr:hypothetical protein TNCV_3177801 [Trichonephila clavipes]
MESSKFEATAADLIELHPCLAYNALLKYPIYFAYLVHFLELIGNIREFIIPKKTPKNISGKVPYRFVTHLYRLTYITSTVVKMVGTRKMYVLGDNQTHLRCDSTPFACLASVSFTRRMVTNRLRGMWKVIPQDVIFTLIGFVPRRVVSCIALYGDSRVY